MIKRLSTLLLLTTLVACTNQSEPPVSKEDGVAAERETTPSPGSPSSNPAFPSLFRYFSEQNSRFSPGKFEEAGTSRIDTSAALPVDEEQVTPFYPYLLYNSDSTYAIDLYSYNYVITTRNNKTVAEEGGPDTEVALIDLKNKTRKRVFFGGTSTAVYDAKWASDRSFLLATGEMISSQSAETYGVQPELLLYDMAQGVVKHFLYPDTLQVKKGAGYNANRLPGD